MIIPELTSVDSYVYLSAYLFPFLTQLGVPIGLTIVIVYLGSQTYSIANLIFFILTLSLILLFADMIAYFIGKKYGNILILKLEKYEIGKQIKKAIRLAEKNVFFAVILTRTLILGAGPIINYVLGVRRISVTKFVILLSIGEICYVTTFILIGFVFKNIWDSLFAIIQDLSSILIILIILYYVLKYFYKNYLR